MFAKVPINQYPELKGLKQVFKLLYIIKSCGLEIFSLILGEILNFSPWLVNIDTHVYEFSVPDSGRSSVRDSCIFTRC